MPTAVFSHICADATKTSGALALKPQQQLAGYLRRVQGGHTTLMKKISGCARLTILLSAWTLVAAGQSSTPASPAPPPQAHQEPCWRQAGIDRSVAEQRHTIERDSHFQVETVCEDSSLTPRQKQQQVREIRQQAKQKEDALLTPSQQQALRACQQQRAADHPSAHNGGGGGPCGHEQSPQNEASHPTGKAAGSNPQQPENDASPQN